MMEETGDPTLKQTYSETPITESGRRRSLNVGFPVILSWEETCVFVRAPRCTDIPLERDLLPSPKKRRDKTKELQNVVDQISKHSHLPPDQQEAVFEILISNGWDDGPVIDGGRERESRRERAGHSEESGFRAPHNSVYSLESTVQPRIITGDLLPDPFTNVPYMSKSDGFQSSRNESVRESSIFMTNKPAEHSDRKDSPARPEFLVEKGTPLSRGPDGPGNSPATDRSRRQDLNKVKRSTSREGSKDSFARTPPNESSQDLGKEAAKSSNYVDISSPDCSAGNTNSHASDRSRSQDLNNVKRFISREKAKDSFARTPPNDSSQDLGKVAAKSSNYVDLNSSDCSAGNSPASNRSRSQDLNNIKSFIDKEEAKDSFARTPPNDSFQDLGQVAAKSSNYVDLSSSSVAFTRGSGGIHSTLDGKKGHPHEMNKNDNHGRNKNDNHGRNKNDNHGGNKNDNHGRNKNDNHGGNKHDKHGRNKNDNHGKNKNDNHGENKSDNHVENKNDNHVENKNDNHPSNSPKASQSFHDLASAGNEDVNRNLPHDGNEPQRQQVSPPENYYMSPVLTYAILHPTDQTASASVSGARESPTDVGRGVRTTDSTGRSQHVCQAHADQHQRCSMHWKSVLKGVTGIAHPGVLLAIMGSSGAGKSTLLDVLAGRKKNGCYFSGKIRLNGKEVKTEMRSMSAYVKRTAVFLAKLTVQETLAFRTIMEMGNLEKARRVKRVRDILRDMELIGCADFLIGCPGTNKGITKGEARRLSLGCEMVSKPPLIFCDDPTSGLDAREATATVKVLDRLAERQHSVVCVLRQPSSNIFSYFDKVLLLTAGRVAFTGTCSEALSYFGSMGEPCPQYFNPTDFFIETLTVCGHPRFVRLKAEMAHQRFQYTVQAKDIRDEIDNLKRSNFRDIVILLPSSAPRRVVPWLLQFHVNFWRCYITLMREATKIRVGSMGVLMLSLMIGGTFYRLDTDGDGVVTGYDQHDVLGVNGALFTICTVSGLFQCYYALNLLPHWLPILLQDFQIRLYRVDAFYLALSLAELPLHSILPFLFVSVNYWMVGLRDDVGGFFVAVAVVTLSANVSASFGHMVLMYAGGDRSVAEVWAAGTLTWLVLVSGFLVNAASVPHRVSWLRYISWFWHSQELLMVNQWRSIDHIHCPDSTDHNIITTEINSTTLFNNTVDLNMSTTISFGTTPSIDTSLNDITLYDDTTMNISAALDNDTTEIWCMFSDGSDVLQQFGFSSEDGVFHFLILVLLWVGLRLSAFLFLSRLAKKAAQF